MLSNILARRSLVFLMSDEMPENGIVMALVAKKPAVAPTVATAPVAIHSPIQSTINNQLDCPGMGWQGRARYLRQHTRLPQERARGCASSRSAAINQLFVLALGHDTSKCVPCHQRKTAIATSSRAEVR